MLVIFLIQIDCATGISRISDTHNKKQKGFFVIIFNKSLSILLKKKQKLREIYKYEVKWRKSVKNDKGLTKKKKNETEI